MHRDDRLTALLHQLDGHAARLRLWDHFGESLGPHEAVYRAAQRLIAGLDRGALFEHVSQDYGGGTTTSLAEIVDWTFDEARAWAKTFRTTGFPSVARAGTAEGIAWLRAFADESRDAPDMLTRRQPWTRGNKAWLALIECGHADTDRLRTFWTNGPYGREASARISALPPASRAALDRALVPALHGDAVLRLVCDYGPVRADHLAPTLIKAARPRDVEFAHDGSVTGALKQLEVSGGIDLSRLPGDARLCAAAVARPSLFAAIAASFDVPPSTLQVLRRPFPPVGLSAPPPPLVPALIALSLGKPGDPVPHGVFPSRVTKIARVWLAVGRHWKILDLAAAAQAAYTTNVYAAHDAVACALICGMDPFEVEHSVKGKGHKLRQKYRALVRLYAPEMR